MGSQKKLEQHIAVFGESGSGKTVLISSFYGAAQEPEFSKQHPFHVVAKDPAQGIRLHQNYLGMKNSARLPQTSRFAATEYSFSIKFKGTAKEKASKVKAFDALSLIWHDYPGEWFEHDVDGQEEAQRRVNTFKSLLGSDVALLLVDGQRLLDNHDQEERYLKSLLSNFRNGLLTLKEDLLDGGKPLARFPRMWVMALTKSDLLPDTNVVAFRDMVIEKAGGDLDELRQVIADLVEAKQALSVGEDFVLLSSARFTPDQIRVDERVGVDLIHPIASMLPLERHLKWASAQLIPGKLAPMAMHGAKALRGVSPILGKVKLPDAAGAMVKWINPVIITKVLDLAETSLEAANAQAIAKRDYLVATLTQFRIDLNRAEAEKTLIRSPRWN